MRAERCGENERRQRDDEGFAHIGGGGGDAVAALEGLKLKGAGDAAAALRIEGEISNCRESSKASSE